MEHLKIEIRLTYSIKNLLLCDSNTLVIEWNRLNETKPLFILLKTRTCFIYRNFLISKLCEDNNYIKHAFVSVETKKLLESDRILTHLSFSCFYFSRSSLISSCCTKLVDDLQLLCPIQHFFFTSTDANMFKPVFVVHFYIPRVTMV